MKRTVLLMAVAALVIPLAANAASPQKAGRWETTMQMEMPGAPVKIPPITTAVCISKEDADNPERSLPSASRDKNAKCKISDYKIDGNTVTWKINCEGARPVSGSGKITYSGDSYEGGMDLKVGENEMHARYVGKFMGACNGTETNTKQK